MRSHVDSAVKIQTTSESNFSPPSWLGEIVVMSRYLRTHGCNLTHIFAKTGSYGSYPLLGIDELMRVCQFTLGVQQYPS
jgi:hypothetical protein